MRPILTCLVLCLASISVAQIPPGQETKARTYLVDALEEQNRIVRTVKQLRDQCDRVAKMYDKFSTLAAGDTDLVAAGGAEFAAKTQETYTAAKADLRAALLVVYNGMAPGTFADFNAFLDDLKTE